MPARSPMAKVDWILHNATVVTMDEGYRVLRDGAVAVEGDSISAVGPAKEILATYTAHELIDCRGSALIPGLVNAHTHAPMTLLRGMADDLRLEVWLLGYMMPVEREFVSPDFCRLGTLLACAEMIRSGITCFADMYYFEDAVAQATAEAGQRAVCPQPGLEFTPHPSEDPRAASGFAPMVDMLEAGLSVGIGTDGPAANNDLDMFEEMRLATFIAKGVSGDPTALPARLTLALATRLGARALHLGHLTGSIEPGKRADLALVDLGGIHHQPQFERDSESIYSRLVYACKGNDVSDVMVNGRWLMRERILQTIDVAPLIQAAADYASRLDVFLIEREGPGLTHLVAIEGAE